MPSENESLRRWLSDIGYHIAKAQSFVEGMSYEAFCDDDLRFYATTRCLEIISEASRRLPAAMKERHPSIPWQAIAAAGNFYRHDYDNVAASRVWSTLTHSLPPLAAIVTSELAAVKG